jgi:mRNA degradation ribonuclease J1/J2
LYALKCPLPQPVMLCASTNVFKENARAREKGRGQRMKKRGKDIRGRVVVSPKRGLDRAVLTNG